MSTLGAWQFLTTPQAEPLLDACRDTDLEHPATLERLRRVHTPEHCAAAIELTLARRAGAPKFGMNIHAMLCDREGVQMASAPEIAAHKARRCARMLESCSMLDLCSGIGADAMALSAEGLDITAYDISPVRAFMTQHNARCSVRTCDVTTEDLPMLPVHCDPQRRQEASARRTPTLDELVPGIDFLRAIATRHPAVCIKLFPGVDPAHLPDGEVEFISQHGRLRQAVLWTGSLACVARSATTFPAGATIQGVPGPAPIASLDRFVYAVDPAVERASLIGVLAGELSLGSPHPSSGLLTGPRLLTSPFVSGFEVLEHMPWSLRRVRQALASHDAGIVEIKTRGQVIDPDRLQRDLRGRGRTTLTLFVLRFGSSLQAIITRRCDAA